MARTGLFFSFAHNFWPHTAVTATSVLDYASDLDIHIFSDEINRRWLAKIRAIARRSNSDVHFHQFDTQLVKNLKHCGHYGLSTYYRLFIPDILSNYYSNLIYLDSDMVARASVHDLMASCQPVHLLAAAPGISRRSNQTHAKRLNHGKQCPYFNAGNMVINAPRWRELSIRDQCLAFQEKYPDRIRYADQDMLNYCLAGQWQPLPVSWNVMVDYFAAADANDLEGISPTELKNALDNPMIIHFNGEFKPWHLTYRHRYKSSYTDIRRRLQKTPYISDDFPGGLFQKLVNRLRRWK